MRSPLIRKLREDQEKGERRAERARRRHEKEQAGRIEAVGMEEMGADEGEEKKTTLYEENAVKKDE